ncbi:mucin-5AC-like, partial [Tympanuchus pallidicinctus]|uniref:mucin-5AC-like n=1 Tax=Tympanuchus pallidicinctus TaxID=109042 RepID=UPI0022875106
MLLPLMLVPPPGCCGGDAALRRLTEQPSLLRNPSLSPAWTVPPPSPLSGSTTTIATVATALTNLGPQPAPMAISTAPTLGTNPRTSPLPTSMMASVTITSMRNPSLSPAWTVPPPSPSSGSMTTIATVATALTNLGPQPAPMAISTAPMLGTEPRSSPLPTSMMASVPPFHAAAPPGCCGGDAALRRLTEQPSLLRNPSLSPAWTVPPPSPSSGSMTTIATVATALTNLGPQPAPMAISTAPTLGTEPRTSPLPTSMMASVTITSEESQPFTCLDGSSTIAFEWVNDDYCDCRDGSDEPGTSACPSGHFHCTNAGYRAQNIPSAHVNDGVCDAVEVMRPCSVSLSNHHFYEESQPFTCLDGSSTIAFKWVNDDYCDCRDGSDEPGTSACPNGHFHCTNAGYRPQHIPSAHVNDGVCGEWGVVVGFFLRGGGGG